MVFGLPSYYCFYNTSPRILPLPSSWSLCGGSPTAGNYLVGCVTLLLLDCSSTLQHCFRLLYTAVDCRSKKHSLAVNPSPHSIQQPVCSTTVPMKSLEPVGALCTRRNRGSPNKDLRTNCGETNSASRLLVYKCTAYSLPA